jgi:tRNA U34 2-thiouridine synthase MnmA/TrmU
MNDEEIKKICEYIQPPQEVIDFLEEYNKQIISLLVDEIIKLQNNETTN